MKKTWQTKLAELTAAERSQARIAFGTALMFFAVFNVAAPIRIFFSAVPIPMLEHLAPSYLLMAYSVYTTRKNPAGHLGRSTVLLSLLGIVWLTGYYSNGLEAPFTVALTLLPVFAGFLIGRVAAKVFFGLSIATGLVFHLLTSYPGLLPPTQITPAEFPVARLISLVVLSSLSLGVAVLYESVRDSERQMRTELELERSKSSHAARLASLGELSAGIAHEINNPLTIIIGTVRTLPKSIDDPALLGKKIQVITKSSERIAKIIQGLTKFARSSEKAPHQLRSLRDIATEAISLTRPKSNSHSVTVSLVGSLPCNVLCDEVEIEQVLINLINNAVDAVKHQAEKWITLTLAELGATVVLTVMDSGHGISADIQEKLFQPFFTTKPVGEGTGLGLSIAKGILAEHAATIEIVKHQHTCFELRFKLATSTQHAA